jgi:hypothetical protein
MRDSASRTCRSMFLARGETSNEEFSFAHQLQCIESFRRFLDDDFIPVAERMGQLHLLQEQEVRISFGLSSCHFVPLCKSVLTSRSKAAPHGQPRRTALWRGPRCRNARSSLGNSICRPGCRHRKRFSVESDVKFSCPAAQIRFGPTPGTFGWSKACNLLPISRRPS